MDDLTMTNENRAAANSLIKLAEVASKELEYEDAEDENVDQKECRSYFDQSPRRVKEYYSFNDLMDMDDAEILRLFTDVTKNDINQTIIYTCYLMPDTCQKMCSNRNGKSAQREMIEHLREHLEPLMVEKKLTTRQKGAILFEPVQSLRTRLRSVRKTPEQQSDFVMAVSPPYASEHTISPSSSKGRRGGVKRGKIGLKDHSPSLSKRKKHPPVEEQGAAAAGLGPLRYVFPMTRPTDRVEDHMPCPDHAYTYTDGPWLPNTFGAGSDIMTQQEWQDASVSTLDACFATQNTPTASNILPLAKLDRIPVIIVDESDVLFSHSLIGAQEIVADQDYQMSAGTHEHEIVSQNHRGMLFDGHDVKSIIIEAPSERDSHDADPDDEIMMKMVRAAQEYTDQLYQNNRLDESVALDVVYSARRPKRGRYPPMPKASFPKGMRLNLLEDLLVEGEQSDERQDASPPAASVERGAEAAGYARVDGRFSAAEPAGLKPDAAASGTEASMAADPRWERRVALECIRELRKYRGRSAKPDRMCKLCGRQFTVFNSLLLHLRSHAGIKPYVCMICNRSFTRQHSLNYHMLIHNSQNRFECAECHKGFRHSTHFREHMRIHTGETPYECVACDSHFRSRTAFRRHLLSRHKRLLNGQQLIPVNDAGQPLEQTEESLWPNLAAMNRNRLRTFGRLNNDLQLGISEPIQFTDMGQTSWRRHAPQEAASGAADDDMIFVEPTSMNLPVELNASGSGGGGNRQVPNLLGDSRHGGEGVYRLDNQSNDRPIILISAEDENVRVLSRRLLGPPSAAHNNVVYRLATA